MNRVNNDLVRFMKESDTSNLISIFGVKICFQKYEDLLYSIYYDDSIRLIGSVNKHFLNLAYENEDFKEKLNKCDFIFPDGVGVKLAAKLLTNFRRRIYRTNCPDLLVKLLHTLNVNKNTIFLFGATSKVIKKTVSEIRKRFPQVTISGYSDGYTFENEKLVDEINSNGTEYLVVGLGGIRQESWALENIDLLKVRKLILVGGAFRVLAGERLRGPRFIQYLGLEWFVRFLTEPLYIWKRYLIGIPLFIFRIVKEKLDK